MDERLILEEVAKVEVFDDADGNWRCMFKTPVMILQNWMQISGECWGYTPELAITRFLRMLARDSILLYDIKENMFWRFIDGEFVNVAIVDWFDPNQKPEIPAVVA